MKIAIVEDEALASNYLKTQLLKQTILPIDEITILSSVQEATAFLFQNTVDLLFMDIHLGDGNSLEIFEQIQIKSPIIFTTAYDSYAIQVFKQFTIDYILKPFSAEDLENALTKFVSIANLLTDSTKTLDGLSVLNNEHKEEFKERLTIHNGHKLKSINLDEIAYFFASGKHLFIHTFKNDRYIYADTIKDIISKINPDTFFKINRKIIVHRNAIKEIIRHNSQKIEIVLYAQIEDDAPILVSKTQINLLRTWLE